MNQPHIAVIGTGAWLGALPGLRTPPVMTGFPRHGFQVAPIFGEIAAHLVLRRDTEHDITHPDSSRFVSA